MPLLELDQRSDAWVQARVGRITASVAAACLGLDPYKSRAEAWRTIKGKTYAGNKHTDWGHTFEAMARRHYEVETGEMVQETGFWVHPSLDWLGASPDGFVGPVGLLEVKCPSKLPSKVPVHHHLQMLVQMIVTGREWCDYFVFLPPGAGQEAQFWMQRVYLKGEAGLIRKLKAFYDAYVVPNVEPPRKKRRKKAATTTTGGLS